MKSTSRPRIKTLPRFCLRLVLVSGLVLLVAFAGLVLYLRYIALPDAESWRPRVVSSIESASGLKVSIGRIEGAWQGLRPGLAMSDVRLADRKGAQVLAVRRAEVALAWYALLLGEVRFHRVEVDGPELVLRRAPDGLVYLADLALNRAEPAGDGAFTQWLLRQPRLRVTDATLVWRDERAKAPEVRLAGVEISVRRHIGHHRAALTARPPAHLARRIEMRADLAFHREAERWSAAGDFYAEALQADVAALRAHLPVPETLRAGAGSLRVWAKLSREGLQAVTADLSLRDARAQLAADSLPLDLASISGRASWEAKAGGFTLATRDLRLRTRDGLEARPGAFSYRQSTDAKGAASGEARADGIDLKIAATLIDYFPVPRELKEQVQHYAPRGQISNAAIAWRGESPAKATSLSLSGAFADVAVNAVDARPGASGLTGTLAGDEKGGTLTLASRNARLEMERHFREPLVFDTLDAKARWKVTPAGLEVAIDEARFANPDVAGQVSGTWRALPANQPGHGPGHAELKGTLARFEAPRVANYIPNAYAPTRGWLERSVLAGSGSNVRFEIRGDLWHFPWVDDREGLFRVEADVRDAQLRYHPDWPSVDAIDARVIFEGGRMQISTADAAIFASRVRRAVATIPNLLDHPPVVSVEGEIDTGGTDAVRFLRESPLVNGPGAFTKAVAVEGPAQFALKLHYPLGGMEPVRVQGDYTFAGATARVATTLAFNNVRGRLSFTEKGVRAPELTGTMFGQPAMLRMASQPDGSVVTEIDGRIAMPVLGAYVPDPIAAKLSGSLDWRARLVSGRDGSELTVTSDLKGLGVGLPAPFAKDAAAARPLSIAIRPLGGPGEVTTATLDGVIHARFMRDAGGEQWKSALKFGAPFAAEPVREGLWLYGELAQIDLDAWLSVFPRPEESLAAAAAGTRGAAQGELRGFDLKIGHVLFTRRSFPAMSARLERSGTEWKGRLEGENLAGDVSWNAHGKGAVVARLSRLALRLQGPEGGARETQRSEGDLPALDVVAENFSFKGNALGRLDLKAEPEGDNWRIQRLDIRNPHTTFTSKGLWRETGAGSITTLDLGLETTDLNALFAQFGYGDYMKGGTGKLQGNLAWPGFPYEFELGNLQGSFRLEAARGQFAKIQAGAGKLLGLLSLQSLPRRVTLDFRDVFSEGFAFESIGAQVKVARGILLTDNLEISGPAALVSMAGEVSMPRETQDLTVRVVPEVGESVALAATFLGTPVLGLSTLLVSKILQNPFGRVVAYEYRVSGTWDNPAVTPVSVPAVRPPRATAEAGPARGATVQ